MASGQGRSTSTLRAANLLQTPETPMSSDISTGDNVTPRPSKRARTSRHPEPPRPLTTTTAVRQALEAAYGIPASGMPRFVGICAYLCTLLQWGWQIKTTDLDAFILLDVDFAVVRPRLEELQLQEENLAIPSYHEWFLEQPRDTFSLRILTESTLREIWRENHYEFLRAELSLLEITRCNAPWLRRRAPVRRR